MSVTNSNTNGKKLESVKALGFLGQNNFDESFLRIFKPYRIVQKILGSSRVNVKDRFVTAPTTLQKCYTVIFEGTVIYSGILLMHTYLLRRVTDSLMIYIYMFGVLELGLSCCLSSFHTRFFNNKENIELYTQMQKIDRDLRMNDLNHNVLYKHNLYAVLASVIFCGFVITLTGVVADELISPLEMIAPTIVFASFIYELACCSSHIMYFTNCMRLLNYIIMKHFEKQNKYTKDISKIRRTWKYGATKQQDFESSETDVYIKNIFSGFNSFQKLYGFQIFLFCVLFIGWTVLPFLYTILALQKNMKLKYLLLDFIHIITMIVIQTITLLVLCIRTEEFFRQIRETKRLTIYVMSRYSDGPFWYKAKKMLKTIENTPASFSVYGMWHLDARLLLFIFQIVTTAFVTILQFAYL